MKGDWRKKKEETNQSLSTRFPSNLWWSYNEWNLSGMLIEIQTAVSKYIFLALYMYTICYISKCKKLLHFTNLICIFWVLLIFFFFLVDNGPKDEWLVSLGPLYVLGADINKTFKTNGFSLAMEIWMVTGIVSLWLVVLLACILVWKIKPKKTLQFQNQ